MLTIHNEELTRRKDFQSLFEGHFLNSLFPGMDDLPSTFATQAPSTFDSQLPRLCTEDVEFLKRIIPELQEFLQVPDMSHIINFFYNKSVVKTNFDNTDEKNFEDKLVEVVKEVGLESNLDKNMFNPTDEEEPCFTSNILMQIKEIDRLVKNQLSDFMLIMSLSI